MKFHKLRKLCYSTLLLSSLVHADITGNVFIDFNLNGAKDGGDTGLTGISIHANCDDGSTVDVTTDNNGDYSVSTGGSYCRIEADPSSVGYYAGQNAQGSHTLVERVANGSTHNISIASPSSYCQSNPDVVLVGMPGNYDANGDANDNSEYGTLLKGAMPADGNNDGNSDRVLLAKAKDTGAIWGLAYAKTDKKLYTAATVRRFVFMKDADGDGYGDAGAIYVTDKATSTTARLITIPNTDVGYTPGVKTADRDNQDENIYKYSGKSGFGDIDISEDEKYLYVTNIGAKKLVKVDISAKTYTQVAIPNPYGADCPSENVVPWGYEG